MNPIDYLKALRRRWSIVASGLAVALAAGWFATSGASSAASGSGAQLYKGTTVLLSNGEDRLSNLATLATLTTVGEVPVRAARALNYSGSPLALAARIEAVADSKTGLLTISATSPDPAEAKQLADTFANELIGFVREQKQKEASPLAKQMEQLKAEIAVLDARMARDPSQAASLKPQRDAKSREYASVSLRYQQTAPNIATAGIPQIIQGASPQPVEGAAPPALNSRIVRMLLAGVLGLLVGAAAALVLDRFDTRIRTKQAAEQHFGLPVLGEIPPVPWPKRGRPQIVAADPLSPSAEAFRVLATQMNRWSSLQLTDGGNGNGHANGKGPGRTILVTSPAPSEGKTTVVANLAATFAELGHNVLVLSCDFRRPKIHRFFGTANSSGIVDAIYSSDRDRVLDDPGWRTGLQGVRLVPSGPPPERPTELLSSPTMRALLAQARRDAEIVLIDTAPILAASDAALLIPDVDEVLVVARAGKTGAGIAERAAELLRRLGAPLVGVALNGSTETSAYYRNYYAAYMREQRPRRGWAEVMGFSVGAKR